MIDSCRLVKVADFNEEWHRLRAYEMALDSQNMHRKFWELTSIAQVFTERVKPHVKGVPPRVIGFGCGREQLPAWFASRAYARVTASDQPQSPQTSEWASTGQYSAGLSDLPWRGICSEDALGMIKFAPIDMRSIPEEFLSGGYDFTWSAGSMEHIGGIEPGLDFFCQQMRCLRPGGWAAHTTEFEYDPPTGGPGPLDTKNLCVYRSEHIQQLRERLAAQGDRLLKVNLKVGRDAEDSVVLDPPYSGYPHLKIRLHGYAFTSVLLIAVRGGGAA